MLCGRSPLCGPPQTVSSLSCVPFSVRSLLMVNTLLCEHTCHIHRISNTSQFSYQRLTRIVLVTTDPIIAVSLRCLYDGIFPARKPDLHHFCACLSYIGGGCVSGSLPRDCRIDRHWAGVDFFCLRSLGRTLG